MNYDEFAILLLLLRCYCVTADWKTLREGYMGFLLEAFRTSIHLILSFDPEIYAIVLRSLEFSLWATVLAVLFDSVWFCLVCPPVFWWDHSPSGASLCLYHPAEYDHYTWRYPRMRILLTLLHA